MRPDVDPDGSKMTPGATVSQSLATFRQGEPESVLGLTLETSFWFSLPGRSIGASDARPPAMANHHPASALQDPLAALQNPLATTRHHPSRALWHAGGDLAVTDSAVTVLAATCSPARTGVPRRRAESAALEQAPRAPSLPPRWQGARASPLSHAARRLRGEDPFGRRRHRRRASFQRGSRSAGVARDPPV